jgi:hypothetical protein
MRMSFGAASAVAMVWAMAGTAAAQQRASAPGQPLAGSYQLQQPLQGSYQLQQPLQGSYGLLQPQDNRYRLLSPPTPRYYLLLPTPQ